MERKIKPPSRLLLALEPRGVLSIASLLAAAPFLASAPRGDGHSVIVLPGLGAGDRSTIAIRRFLAYLGYRVSGWNLGRNIRPSGADLPAVAAQIASLCADSGRPVSLIGWSRGGIIARETARQVPEAIRLVITLGSPFREPGASNVARFWHRMTGEPFPVHDEEALRRLAAALPVPSTSVYSRTDGVVAWRACLQDEAVGHENIEVRGPHSALGFSPAVLWVIADRLAQPLGSWRPFRPSPLLTPLYPQRIGFAG